MAWDTSKRNEELKALRNKKGESWETIRKRIFRRDLQKCQTFRQGRKCLATATQIDHIVRGDNHEDDNLVAICKICHGRKSSAEGLAARTRNNKRAETQHPGRISESE